MPVNRFPLFGCFRISSIVCGENAFSGKPVRHILRKFAPLTLSNLLNCTKISFCPQHYEINDRLNTPGKIPPQVHTDHYELRSSLYICTFRFSRLTQTRDRSTGTKFFRMQKKYSHSFGLNIRRIISVTRYSHNSPNFYRLSSESARIYKCQAEREAEKQKHFIKKNIKN